jgi:serine/threonine protein kinase/HPt (histidine-containing phosphotransfer) domain-containing protein
VFDRELPIKHCPVDGDDLTAVKNYFPNGKIGESFIVSQLIGCGTFGLVFRATQTSLKRTVAIKLLHRHLLERTDVSSRFMREAAIISQLKHPNITSVVDYGVLATGEPYLIMEFLSGISLVHLLRQKGLLTFAEAYPIIGQLCAGLSAAHAQSIIHRDIKPSNIFILNCGEPDQLVKLVDFGLAKVVDDTSSAARKLTESGISLGTPQYMSPEACRGAASDERSDIYALGCVMYEMLTGSPVVAGGNALETMNKHINQAPVGFECFGVMVPQAVQQVVRKTLAKEPSERFQTIGELKSALEKCAAICARHEARDNDRSGSEKSSDNVVTFLSEVARHRQNFSEELRGLVPSLRLAWHGSSFLLNSNAGRTMSTSILTRVLSAPSLLGARPQEGENVFDLANLIESTAVQFANEARQKNISFMIHLSADLPLEVLGNPAYIKQAIAQILDNAITHTRSGAVTLTASLKSVEKTSCTVGVHVSDTGMGIAQKDIATVFIPFLAQQPTVMRPHLGLCITRHLVKIMGGEMVLESMQDTGTNVSLSLNLKVVNVWDRADQPSSLFAGMRMLIISSAANVSFAISAYGKEQGILCTSVQSGAQALAEIEKSAGRLEPYQLVMFDTASEDIRSFAVRMGSSHQMRGLKSIYIVNQADNQRFSSFPGFIGFLSKPVARGDLLDCLLHALAVNSTAEVRVGSPQQRTDSSGNKLSMGEFTLDLEETEPVEADETVLPFSVEDQTLPLTEGEADGIDMDALETASGRELAAQMVRSFILTVDRLVENMKTALARRHCEDLALLARQLRGSASAIPAPRFVRLATYLDQAASRSDLEQASVLVEAIDWSITKLRKLQATRFGV